ncbi:AAA family ATPase [Salipiger sp. 1_MG-2023]|uniref:ExeA family protein n=1 Tax=Salipiger sp. 1_MG-2023 TaxID=3062665 RepID=UPI0026E43AB5|nr:AAA family ATPase [Salipiger sp. 1_MG-2023]MDO6587004.1 AAA family ATPase [Salipiger sp. 1_MG-2023]
MSDLQHYLQHFSLKTRPFSLAPDPGCMYWSPAHRRAWAMLEYGVMTCAPVTLITGDVGAGKTTLLRHLIETAGADLTIGLVSNAHGSRGELLQWVLQALGLALGEGEGYVTQFDRLQSFLIAEYAAGRRVVLIFDEAQNLSREALEELRMLTNINSGPDELLQLILAGQPELRDMVRRPDMTQFAQRVVASAHLGPMPPDEVRAYIRHRAELAGGEAALFDDAAIDLIAKVTQGVPRLVNQLSEMALLYAFTDGVNAVTRDNVQTILDDDMFFGGETLPPQPLVESGAARRDGEKWAD